MRISTHAAYQMGIQPMLDHQSNLADVQAKISSGKKFLTPSEDPITSARLMQLDKQVRLNEQYDRNVDFAQGRLELEETSMQSVGDILQRARELTIQANNAPVNSEDRHIIAQEISQLRQQLVDVSNTKDSEGSYLFAGFAEHVKPFTTATNGGTQIVYNGDEGQRLLRVGPSREIAVGDHGKEVFMNLRQGSEQFQTAPSINNTGLGEIRIGGITDPAAYQSDFVGHEYKVVFSENNTFDVLEVTEGMVNPKPVLSLQNYSPGQTGQAISFRGVQVTLSGEVKKGDEFTVKTAQNTSMFEVFDNLVNALEAPVNTAADNATLGQSLNNVITDFDQCLLRSNLTLGKIGGRMNALSAQSDVNQAFNIQLKSLSSKLGDVDYAEAATKLSEEMLALQAAQSSFVKIQGLSLFDYIN